jgi:hypothetical protein
MEKIHDKVPKLENFFQFFGPFFLKFFFSTKSFFWHTTFAQNFWKMFKNFIFDNFELQKLVSKLAKTSENDPQNSCRPQLFFEKIPRA